MVEGIEMDLKGIRRVGLELILLSRDIFQRRPLVSTVMNLHISNLLCV
jgi:hypothetical protein